MADEDHYPKKRATAAGNAKDIRGLKDQLSGMEAMLKTLVEGKKSQVGDVADGADSCPEVHEEEEFRRPLTPTSRDAGLLARGRARSASGVSSPQDAPRRHDSMDSRGWRWGEARELHESVADLHSDEELQRCVCMYAAFAYIASASSRNTQRRTVWENASRQIKNEQRGRETMGGRVGISHFSPPALPIHRF